MTRSQLLEALRKAERREALLSATERAAHIGHYEWNRVEGRLESCSEEYASIFNMSVDEIMAAQDSLESTILQIHPDDREHFRKHVDSLNGTTPLDIKYRIIRRNGEQRYIHEVGIASPGDNGIKRGSFGILQDITEQQIVEQQLLEAKNSLEATVKLRTAELAETVERLKEEIKQREKVAAELEFLANHDALTGLPSLRLCKDRLDHSLAASRRNRQMAVVMFLDLDDFKLVNDSYGHECGDIVLKTIADRIKAEIREVDTVARIGGDEFEFCSLMCPTAKLSGAYLRI